MITHCGIIPAITGFINREDFLGFLTAKQGLKPSSVKLCLTRLDVLNGFLAGRTPSPKIIEEFIGSLQTRGLKNSSINSYLFLLKQVDRYINDRKLPFEPLSAGLRSFQKDHPMIDILSLEDMERLCESHLNYGLYKNKYDSNPLNATYRALIRFYCTTGARFTEGATLRVKNVDLVLGTALLEKTKTGEPRYAYLSEPLISQLKRLIADKSPDSYVFTGMGNRPIHPQSFLEDFKKRALSLGIKKRVYAHLIRHSYITHAITSGIPVETVAQLVGHRDIQTTYSTYYHSQSEYLQKMARRFPMVRKNMSTKEVFELIKQAIHSLGIESDVRLREYFEEDETHLFIKFSTQC